MIVQSLEEGLTSTYCEIAVTALVLYQHTITLSNEFHHAWRFRMTGTTLLLLLTRYTLVFNGLANILSVFPWTSPIVCEAVNVVQLLFFIFLYAVEAGFSTLRIYAVTGGKWRYALVPLLAGLVPVGTNFFNLSKWSYATVAYLGDTPLCVNNTSLSPKMNDNFLIATRACAILSDLIVISVTWLHTHAFNLSKGIIRARSHKPLTSALMRDGTIYFVVLLLLNILQIVTNTSWSVYGDYVSGFLSPAAGVLITIFMFNLRQISVQESESMSSGGVLSSPESHATIQFTSRVVANMGASLDHSGSASDGVIYDAEEAVPEGCNEQTEDDSDEIVEGE